jgi:hypothetical protein
LLVISEELQAGDITVINPLVSWQGINIRTLFWYHPVAQLFMWPELLFTWLIYPLPMAIFSQMTPTMWVSLDLITWSGWGNVPRGVIRLNIKISRHKGCKNSWFECSEGRLKVDYNYILLYCCSGNMSGHKLQSLRSKCMYRWADTHLRPRTPNNLKNIEKFIKMHTSSR